MRQLADDLYQLGGFPPNAVNVYLAGGVVIDAGGKPDRRRILRQLKGHEVTAHALTHSHPDHDGASKAVCETLGIPYWVGEADVEAAENDIVPRDHPMQKLSAAVYQGPRHKVDRALREGDEVGGFVVLETPGHTAGHVAYWREADRSLILGDVLNGMHLLTTIPGLHTPPDFFTADPAQNRDSARKLAKLEPSLICFGHGPPMRDTKKFTDFIAGLA